MKNTSYCQIINVFSMAKGFPSFASYVASFFPSFFQFFWMQDFFCSISLMLLSFCFLFSLFFISNSVVFFFRFCIVLFRFPFFCFYFILIFLFSKLLMFSSFLIIHSLSCFYFCILLILPRCS